jgi:enolase
MQILENKEGLLLIVEAIEMAGYTGKVKIGMDVAASEFFKADDKMYDLDFKTEPNDGSQKLTGEKLQELYESFCADFPMVSIEDPFDQDDFASYKRMTAKIGESVQVVGDDLLVTNPTRVQKAIDEGACNALLLKVNQIGSITEAIEAVNMAKKAGWGVMTSHRSGETEDSFIADLAVGLKTGQIKTGAPCRSERLAKYNQLLRIEEELGEHAIYTGAAFRMPPPSGSQRAGVRRVDSSLAGRALQAVSRLHALRLVAAHNPTRALRAAGLTAPLAGRWVPTPAARLALPFRALARGGVASP